MPRPLHNEIQQATMPPVANPNPDRARRGAAAPAPDERALTVRNESSDSDDDSAAIIAAQRAMDSEGSEDEADFSGGKSLSQEQVLALCM